MSPSKRAPFGALTRELVVAAQNHDQNALERLLLSHEALIRAATAYVSGTEHDFDTFVQDARIEFVASVKAFQSHRGASFSTYAYTRMIRVVAKSVTRARTSSRRFVPLKIGISVKDGGTPDRPDPDDQFGQADLHDAVERLPASECRLVAAMYWDDFSQAKMARVWGVSQQAISKRHRVAINTLRSHFGA